MNSSSKILHSVEVEVNPSIIKKTFSKKEHKNEKCTLPLYQKRKNIKSTKLSPFKLSNRIAYKININLFSPIKPNYLNAMAKNRNEIANLNIMGNSISSRGIKTKNEKEETPEKKFLKSFYKNFDQRNLEENTQVPKSAGIVIQSTNRQGLKNQSNIKVENFQYENILNYPFLSLYEKIKLSGLLYALIRSSRQITKPEKGFKRKKDFTNFSISQLKIDSNSKNIPNYEPLFSINSYSFESNSQKERCRKIASVLFRLKSQIQGLENESDIFDLVQSVI